MAGKQYLGQLLITSLAVSLSFGLSALSTNNPAYHSFRNNQFGGIRFGSSNSKAPELISQNPIVYKTVEQRVVNESIFMDQQKADYIDLGRSLTQEFSTFSENPKAVVELVVVCDKDFGDIFNQNKTKIMNYLTVYFWDINMRFKTLKSVDVSFQINGVVVMEDAESQPFIENARAPDGRAEMGRILGLYKNWVYEKRSSLPSFDLAPLITATNLEWGGGLAHMNAACWARDSDRVYLGTLVWNDGGDFGSTITAAHELAHSLGAPHDEDFGNELCRDGFVMSGGWGERRFAFSSCSDNAIRNFVTSDGASCLKITSAIPVISETFSPPNAPEMAEQCKTRLNNSNAWIEEWSLDDCNNLRCVVPDVGFSWIYDLHIVENTPCGKTKSKRCFRGRCREIPRFLTADSYTRMMVTERFGTEGFAEIKFDDIFQSLETPLDMVVITGTENGNVTLSVPYLDNYNTVNGEKCLKPDENGFVVAQPCDGSIMQEWELIWIHSKGFQMKNWGNNKCARQDVWGKEGFVKTVECNKSDSLQTWSNI